MYDGKFFLDKMQQVKTKGLRKPTQKGTKGQHKFVKILHATFTSCQGVTVKRKASYIPGRVVSPLSAAGRASTGSTGHVQQNNKK